MGLVPPAITRTTPKHPGYHASRELFRSNLVDAAVDAKKSLRLIANHGQRADHPVLLAIPETEYLKGLTAELMAGR